MFDSKNEWHLIIFGSLSRPWKDLLTERKREFSFPVFVPYHLLFGFSSHVITFTTCDNKFEWWNVAIWTKTDRYIQFERSLEMNIVWISIFPRILGKCYTYCLVCRLCLAFRNISFWVKAFVLSIQSHKECRTENEMRISRSVWVKEYLRNSGAHFTVHNKSILCMFIFIFIY